MSSANSAAVNAVLLTIFASLILLAVGETFVIISGGIDLSVGATTGFSGVVAALAMRDLINAHNGEALVLIVGMLICAGIGAGIGLITAALMNWVRLVPFVATLATAVQYIRLGTSGAPKWLGRIPLRCLSDALDVRQPPIPVGRERGHPPRRRVERSGPHRVPHLASDPSAGNRCWMQLQSCTSALQAQPESCTPIERRRGDRQLQRTFSVSWLTVTRKLRSG